MVEFGNEVGHVLDLGGFALVIAREGDQLLLGLQQLLVFLLVHAQVLLGVVLDSVLLVLDHAPLHPHELTHCVSLESVQQVLQPVAEVFSVLVYHLWHHLPLSLHLRPCAVLLLWRV